MIAVIHYDEIGLKGKNRSYFENALVENIHNAFVKAKIKAKVVKDYGRVVCVLGHGVKEDEVSKVLSTIFGIRYYAIGVESGHTVDDLYAVGITFLKDLKKKGKKSVGIRTRRSDKDFPAKSDEINKHLGKEAEKIGFSIDLDEPDAWVIVEIGKSGCYLYADKVKGLGGMPVGTAGKVLCLFSGGIDSAVAAYLMMKRGCRVDFLHVHALADSKDVSNTKIPSIIQKLDVYQSKGKLYSVGYGEYEASTLGNIPSRFDLVVFKHFLFRLAEAFALKKGYRGVVTGDSLAQVASQTLGNIQATSMGISLPIFRPLISFDKEEIMDVGKKIGTYDLSIQSYKDCCSIKAKKASTSVPVSTMKKVLSKIDVEGMVKETLSQIG